MHMETTPLHLVIRFSDTMFSVGDVISLHNEVVDQHGAVWFGKLGGTLSQSRIESRDFPKKEKTLIPHYYGEKKLLKFMNAWVKIGHIEQVEMSTMKNLKTINSIFPIEETLVRSSSGYFLVHESKSIF